MLPVAVVGPSTTPWGSPRGTPGPSRSRDGGAETAPTPGALPCPALAKPHQKPHGLGLTQGIFLPLKYGN